MTAQDIVNITQIIVLYLKIHDVPITLQGNLDLNVQIGDYLRAANLLRKPDEWALNRSYFHLILEGESFDTKEFNIFCKKNLQRVWSVKQKALHKLVEQQIFTSEYGYANNHLMKLVLQKIYTFHPTYNLSKIASTIESLDDYD